MTDRLIIEVDDAQAQRWFSQALARSSDLSGLMAEIGETLLVSTQARFRTGTAPDGVRWLPLADGSGRTPLMDTGTLHDQIAPDHGSDWVELRATAKQARWHQEGTDPYTIVPSQKQALAWPGGPGPRKKVEHPGLPPRPFIGLSQEDVGRIDDLVAAWLDLTPDGG